MSNCIPIKPPTDIYPPKGHGGELVYLIQSHEDEPATLPILALCRRMELSSYPKSAIAAALRDVAATYNKDQK